MNELVQVRVSAINAMGRWTGEVYIHYQTPEYQWRTTRLARFTDQAKEYPSLLEEALHVLSVAGFAVADAEDPIPDGMGPTV